jgi:predicted NACHT family NTPase
MHRFRDSVQQVDLLDAFTHAGPDRELFILGDPGAGKTTALKKLLWAIIHTELDGTRAGLPAATLPVFLLLRSLAPAGEQPLRALVRAELARQAPKLVTKHPDLADQLWARGHLLLLLDGLDEVADPGRRRAICRCLELPGNRAGPGSRPRHPRRGREPILGRG